MMPNESLYKLIFNNHTKNKVAVKDRDIEYSYFELEKLVNEAITILKARDVRPCEHVGLCISNSVKFIVNYLALWHLGATIIPIDSQSGIINIVKIFKISQVRHILISSKKATSNYLKEYQNIDNIKTVFSENLSTIFENKNNEKFLANKNIRNPNNENGYILLYTSGSTGTPKGVILEKNRIISNILEVIKYTGLKSVDSTLMTLPLSYSYGLSQTLAHLIVGGKVIFRNADFEYLSIITDLTTLKVTNFSTTPYFYEIIYSMIKNNIFIPELKNIKFFMNAGGLLSFLVITNIINKFKHINFFNNYGQTEAAPRISYAKYESGKNYEKSLGVGKPLNGIKIKINKKNEIVYKSKYIMRGYFYENKILEFKDTCYFSSKDKGYIDKNENLHIIGRSDSMQKIKGRKIYLRPIEEKLSEIREIKHIKLRLENNIHYGEYLSAYVVLNIKENNINIIKKLYKAFKTKVSGYECPQKIIILDKVKLSSNGKIKI